MVNDRRNFIAKLLLSVIALIVVMGSVGTVALFAQTAESEAALPMTPERAEVAKIGLLAAAAAFGLGAIGAGIGIASVGAAAMGTLGEKPELAGQALIFVALAEGLVVFGFITALIILGRV